MKIASFDAVIESLNKLDPWLRSLGITPKSDRWHQAVKMVRKAKEQRQIIEHGGPQTRAVDRGEYPRCAQTGTVRWREKSSGNPERNCGRGALGRGTHEGD
jgi:hypothetical protein